MNKRSSSAKLLFYDLHGGGAKVQVMADARYSCPWLFFIFWEENVGLDSKIYVSEIIDLLA